MMQAIAHAPEGTSNPAAAATDDPTMPPGMLRISRAATYAPDLPIAEIATSAAVAIMLDAKIRMSVKRAIFMVALSAA